MTLGYVSIDGTEYLHPVVDFQRSFDTEDLGTGRSSDGVLHRPIVYAYINYQVVFAKPHTLAMVTTYASLWNAMAVATPFHTLVMPDGYSFTGYIGTGVKDSINKILNSNIFWKGATAYFIAQSPFASAGGV